MLLVCLGWGPGLAPAGDSLFFASPKKSKQKKGDPAVGVPSLRYGQPAVLAFRGVRGNSLRSNNRGPDPRKAPLLGTPRRECSGLCFARPAEYQQPNQKQKDAPRRVFSFVSGPLCACRGAQLQAERGPRLFERSEFPRTPPEASTAGCPERSAGTRTVGSPFFCLLFFGEAKKSESPAGASPGQQPPNNPAPLNKSNGSPPCSP